MNSLRQGVPIKRIARQEGVTICTIRRRVAEIAEEERDDKGEDDGEIVSEFKRLPACRKCPVHGLVSVWPCVACEAMAMRKSTP